MAHLGVFITFEGPEGSGKTTQIGFLSSRLRQDGYAVVATREPGGTRIGNAVRQILLDSRHTEMSHRAEALLFNAARAQIVDEVIRPALERSQVVVCDRYADSTLAYQGYGHAQELSALRSLAAFATGGLQPDLTIYLDIDPELGLRRKQAGGADEWNRMEERTLAFHRTVRRGYLELAQAEQDRWLVLDATQDLATIQATICQRVLPLCAKLPVASGR